MTGRLFDAVETEVFEKFCLLRQIVGLEVSDERGNPQILSDNGNLLFAIIRGNPET